MADGAVFQESRYGYGREVPYGFDEARARVEEALKAEGFGILTEIRVDEKLREKLGVEGYPRYSILGACNPQLAHRALELEPELGLLLPCNVIVYEHGGRTRVAAMNPLAALGLVGNPALEEVAREADARLRRALAAL